MCVPLNRRGEWGRRRWPRVLLPPPQSVVHTLHLEERVVCLREKQLSHRYRDIRTCAKETQNSNRKQVNSSVSVACMCSLFISTHTLSGAMSIPSIFRRGRSWGHQQLPVARPQSVRSRQFLRTVRCHPEMRGCDEHYPHLRRSHTSLLSTWIGGPTAGNSCRDSSTAAFRAPLL